MLQPPKVAYRKTIQNRKAAKTIIVKGGRKYIALSLPDFALVELGVFSVVPLGALVDVPVADPAAAVEGVDTSEIVDISDCGNTVVGSFEAFPAIPRDSQSDHL